MEHSTRPINRYQVPRDSEGNFIEVELRVPHLRAEGLSLQTWGSSYILASQLHRMVADIQLPRQDGIQILELGAGTGLVGLSAATLCNANAVLTDLNPIVPGLAENIRENEELLAVNTASAACGVLDWNQPSKLTIYGEREGTTHRTLSSGAEKAAVILAADTVYSEEHPRLISDTILAWLKPGTSSRVIIAYPLRIAYLDAIRELWERLNAGGLQCLDEGKAETGDEWDDERSHEWSVWAWQQGLENE